MAGLGEMRRRTSADSEETPPSTPEPMSVLQRVLSKSRMRAFGDDNDDEVPMHPRRTPSPLGDDILVMKAASRRRRSPVRVELIKKDMKLRKQRKDKEASSSEVTKRRRKVSKDSTRSDGSSISKSLRSGTEGLTRDSDGGEGTDSSKASTCSADHSMSDKIRRKKKRRRRCEIHGKRSKRHSQHQSLSRIQSCDGGEGVDNELKALNENDQKEPLNDDCSKGDQWGAEIIPEPQCTCGKYRSRGKRPEPEGGLSQPSSSAYYISEYDKIIYSNDPMFSDLEDDPEVDAQIRLESEKHHSRSRERVGSDSIFSAAQLLNSNTTIKFAIIQTELRNIIEVALRRAEGEVQALTRRIRLLEEDFETTESRLASASEKLEEASKAADESERQRVVIDRRSQASDDRVGELECLYKNAQMCEAETELKYQEVARKLLMTEADLERAENRAETAENKVKEMESELHTVTTNLRSLEINEDKASQREDSYEESIRDLTARLKDAENRAAEAERTVSKLQKEVDRLEDELVDTRMKYKELREDMDMTLYEVQNM